MQMTLEQYISHDSMKRFRQFKSVERDRVAEKAVTIARTLEEKFGFGYPTLVEKYTKHSTCYKYENDKVEILVGYYSLMEKGDWFYSILICTPKES